jgi:hypothetical protein
MFAANGISSNNGKVHDTPALVSLGRYLLFVHVKVGIEKCPQSIHRQMRHSTVCGWLPVN